MAKELIRGVMPKSLTECTIHKTGNKGFRITNALLKSLCNKAEKIKRQGKLIIEIQDGTDTYTINALVSRTKGK